MSLSWDERSIPCSIHSFPEHTQSPRTSFGVTPATGSSGDYSLSEQGAARLDRRAAWVEPPEVKANCRSRRQISAGL